MVFIWIIFWAVTFKYTILLSQHCQCIMSRTLGSGTHGTWHPKCLYYPKGSYYQGLNLEYMTSCDIEVHHLVHIINETIIPYILQTLKCYWAWTQILCWNQKMNMLINFYSSGHQFTKKIITRQSVKIEIKQ